VYLTHGKKQQVLHTAATSAFDLSTLAWYSDVKHEIKPILSGHRLVLTYNLVQDLAVPRQTAAALDASHEELERLLQAWNQDHDYLDYLVYPLAFKYTESSLALKSLKGQDAAKGRYLDQMCAKNGVYWFLSQMTKQKQDEDYEEFDDGYEDEYHRFGDTFLASGQPLALGMADVEKDALLVGPHDLYHKDRTPDSEDEGEFTGNESMPATHRYHNTVFILMRKECVLRNFRSNNLQYSESLLAYFSLIRMDTACTPSMRDDALSAILEKAMAVIAKKDDDNSRRMNHLLGYAKEVQEMTRAKYAKVFETVSDFCFQNGLGPIVSAITHHAMQGKQWTSSKGLVGIIARQIAIEASSGKDNAWSDWYV
jgi:hypothetical protein